jgi:hypothetical protein
VFTIQYAVVLGNVFCLSIAGTPAQDNQTQEAPAAVLTQGSPDPEGIAKHRLTVENVRRMFAVDRELYPLMKESADLQRRIEEWGSRIDPERRLGAVSVNAQVYEALPETAEILRRQRISGREYMLTRLVAMVTAMADDTLTYEAQHEGVKEISPALMTPALKFWRSMDPALKAEAAEWKRMQGYDKGINR